jgi:hypothetical protein
MPRLVAAMFVPLVLAAASGAPALKVQPPYLPTAVGAKWSYQYRGYAEDPTGRELVNVVTAVTERKEVRFVCIAQDIKDGKVGEGIWTAESADGLQHGYFSGDHFVGCHWELKLPHIAGTEWREYRDGLNEPLIREWYTARRSERVEVPAGTFFAERVDCVCEDHRDGNRWSRTKWYVRGVGLVKWVNSSGMSLVLNKFIPAPK